MLLTDWLRPLRRSDVYARRHRRGHVPVIAAEHLEDRTLLNGVIANETDDAYEENDTLATAFDPGFNWELTPLSTIDGLGIQMDDDWYQIEVTAGFELLNVELEFTHAEGDIDLSVHAPNGTLLASSESTTDNESITVLLPSAGTYFLRVYFGNAGNSYDLTWDDLPAFPEITLTGNGQDIADGDVTPSATDHTDFGTASVGGPGVARTFTVTNDGFETLTLSTPMLPAGFTLTEGLNASLAAGASDTFTVTMQTTMVGTSSGEISIANNDNDENPFNFAITAEVLPPTPPEVRVTGNGQDIADGDTTPGFGDHTDFGSPPINSPAPTRTFTVFNDGGQTLTLGAVNLPAGFVLFEGLSTSLAPGASDTFTVELDTLAGVGTKSGDISFSTNDSDENPFNFAITGEVTPPPAPEIRVTGNGQDIADGDTTPASGDHTDFGTSTQGTTGTTRVFTVTNDGNATLNLGAVILPAGFFLTDPLSPSLAPGASDTFSARIITTTPGVKSGEISFSNNDSDENPFNFTITGTVIAPEITVTGNGQDIADGDATPSNADHTNFGDAIAGGPGITRVFTVTNDGDATLTLAAPILPAGFTLTEPLSASLAAGASDTFSVTMSAASTGVKSGEIRITNNDSDENPFNFAIIGNVLGSEITVTGNTQNIADGDNTPSPADHTSFGSTNVGGATIMRTFTVTNDGMGTLTLSTPTLPAGFSITEPLAASLAPGATDTFTVTLQTATAGTKTGDISIANNDSDENPFNFRITGTVTNPFSTAAIYVNDDFTAADGTMIADADPNTPGSQQAVIGTNAFATIQGGVDAVDDMGTVFITDDLFTDGPGIYVENVTIGKNVTIVATDDGAAPVIVDGNAAGRVFEIGAFDVFLTSLVIQNGAAANGGGIFNDGGVLTIDNLTIQNNAATTSGGGIENAGTLFLSNSRVTGNTADVDGGGVHSSTGGVAIVENSLVDANTASESGGGFWAASTGLLYIRNGSIVDGNTASGDAANQGGGGIFNAGGRLVIESTTAITNNIADGTAGSGGGIFSAGGVVTIDDASITGNTANRAGGGIEFVTGVVELRNSNLDNNHAFGGDPAAPGNGGGLHVTGMVGSVGYIRIFGGTVNNNTAAREGGGLWNQAGNVMVVRQGAIVSGNTASGDAADDGGGGIFNNSGRLAIGEAAQITGNDADGALGSGGGIFSTGSAVSLETGSLVDGNTANRAGGGIEMMFGLLTIIDSTISGNDATGAGAAPGNGGGIHISGTTDFPRVDLRNSVVSGNTAAKQGGGLWMSASSVALVRIGSEVSGNTASGDEAGDGGGGIYNDGGRLVIHNASVSSNDADGSLGSGGGVLTVANVTTAEDSTIDLNTAVRAGGGVEVINGLLQTLNTHIGGNDATGGEAGAPGNGGGVHVTGNSNVRVNIFRSVIESNTATSQGGGFWNQIGSIMVVSHGSSLLGNLAGSGNVGDGGAGTFNNGGRLAIANSALVHNDATGDGGAILSVGGGLSVDNSTVAHNDATGNGGGIVNNGDLVSNNTTIAFNLADADDTGGGTGGGVFNGGTATLRNTLLGGNSSTPAVVLNDIAGNNLTPGSHNTLISHAASAGGLMDGINGNIIGMGGSGFRPIETVVDPLADNGGATQTLALAAGSVAINAGNNDFAKDASGNILTTDQRGVGFLRVDDTTVDIGAFEVQTS